MSGDELHNEHRAEYRAAALPYQRPADAGLLRTTRHDATPTSDDETPKSPFTKRGKAVGADIGGGAHRIPPTVANAKRLERWAAIWTTVAKEIGGNERQYRDWNREHMYDQIPEDTTDDEFAVKVHDWFYAQGKHPMYKYRPHEWTVKTRERMAALAHGKRVRNNQTIDEAIKAVLDFLAAENDLGNTTRALELFEIELEEVREDNKMATQPLVDGSAPTTTKPIAQTKTAATPEWYDDAARRNRFFAAYAEFCKAVGITDADAFRRKAQGAEHAKDSKFTSWTEVLTACYKLHLTDAPYDWPKIPAELSAFWEAMFKAGYDRATTSMAMLKRFGSNDPTKIDMDMSRQQFQAVLVGVITAPPPTEAERAAETEAFFARVNGEPPIMNIVRKMYADAGIETDFKRATGFDDAQHAGASGSLDSQIIEWCKADIAKQKQEPSLTANDWKWWLNSNECHIQEAIKALEIAKFSEWKGTLVEAEDKLRAFRNAAKSKPEETENAQNTNDKAPSLNDTVTSGVIPSESNNKPPVGEIAVTPQANVIAFPDSVEVSPAPNGVIVWGGVRFSVKLRNGGTMTAAKALMDEFVAMRELIDPSCLVETGERAAKFEYGTWLMKTEEDEKVTYKIGFNLGKDGTGNEASKPITIATPQALELLEAALAAKGIDHNTLKLGKKYTEYKVNPYWNIGAIMKGERADDPNAKRYKDYVRFDVTITNGDALRRTG